MWRSKRMSKQRKVYKFRMEPTTLQSDELLRMAGTARFIWNWALDRCQTFYKENKKGIPQSQLSSDLTAIVSYPAAGCAERQKGLRAETGLGQNSSVSGDRRSNQERHIQAHGNRQMVCHSNH